MPEEQRPVFTSPIPGKKVEGIPEGLPPEETERLLRLQTRLTGFVLHLIQAFLRTGYYTPEHPESLRAKEGLYQEFQSLFEEEDEIAFLIKDEQERQEVLVEGILPEGQRLSRMMLKGMGELYVPKFVKYLERKDLVSLTLKSRMDQSEFTRFVDVMSEPSLVDTRRRQDKERFAQTLISRGILNISYVFNDELLGSEREMPWRARITLSRIRKDLKMMPLFQRLWGKQLQDIRNHLLWDALRPIRQSDLLCAVLRNSDLAVTTENDEETLENGILSFLQKHYLIGTGKLFLRDHLELKGRERRDRFEQKSDRLVKKICARLRENETRESESLLEEYFRKDLIALEELTPSLKEKILVERLTDKFLAFTERFFLQLDQAREKEKFLTVALSFIKIIPELIRRDRYVEVLRILEALRRHFHEGRMWSLLAGQVLEEIGRGPIPLLLKEKFLGSKKEARSQMIPIFISLEAGAIPSLLTILKTSDDQWVRKNACEALIQIGPVATAHLLRELQNGETSPATTRDIIRLLGEIPSTGEKGPLLELLRRYAENEDPSVREQALHALWRIGKAEEENLFLARLDDPHLEVRKKAAWCLGMIKSSQGARRLVEILNSLGSSPSPETEDLETYLYYALGLFGNLTVGDKTIEQILLDVLQRRGLRPLWGLFHRNPLSEASLLAILESLSRMGTLLSVQTLNRLARSQKGLPATRVKETLRRIEEREESSSPLAEKM